MLSGTDWVFCPVSRVPEVLFLVLISILGGSLAGVDALSVPGI